MFSGSLALNWTLVWRWFVRRVWREHLPSGREEVSHWRSGSRPEWSSPQAGRFGARMASEISELGHIFPLPCRLVVLRGLPLTGPSWGEAVTILQYSGPWWAVWWRLPVNSTSTTGVEASSMDVECSHSTDMPTAWASHDRNNICDFFIVTTSPWTHLYLITIMMANF